MGTNLRCLIQTIFVLVALLAFQAGAEGLCAPIQDPTGTSPVASDDDFAERGSAEQQDAVWRLERHDGVVRGLQEGVSQLRSHSGASSYRLAFQSYGAQEVLATTAIRPSYLIRELQPKVHVFCHQSGVQIMARVVLPETESPSGNGPLTFWVRGQSCQQARRWTSLGFGEGDDSLYARARQHLPVLRSQYGSHVTDQHAYVDQLAVNLCGGSGQQEVFLDSLDVGGQVIVDAGVLGIENSRVQTIQYQEGMEIRPSLSTVADTVVEYNHRPVVIRAIQYNGESMALLRQLGFNTLWMSSPPSLSQLQRARENELWLIAPPPVEDGVVAIDNRYDPVLAWLVGDQVHWSDQAVIKQRVDLIHQVDTREGRPTIVRARTGLADYSRAADIICAGQPVIGTSFPMHLYSDFVQQRIQLGESYFPLIAEIDTELSDELQQQVQAMSGVIPPLVVQPEQIRGMCFQAIAGGARGFLFRSRNRLDGNDLVSQQRRLGIQWTQQQLQQLGPWIASGASMGPVPQANPNVRVYANQTGRSRLLLIQQVTGRESQTAGWSGQELLTVQDSGAGQSLQPYRMTPHSLIPATHRTQGHQMQLQLENAGDWEVIVLTDDPLVVRYVNQVSPGNDHTVLTLQQADLTSELLGRLSRAMVQANRDRPEIRAAVDRVLTLAQSLPNLATSDDPLAYWNQTLMAQREAANIQHQLIVEAQQFHSTATASPLTVHPLLVPLHWQSITRFSGLSWGPNGLPGGDFEDLQHMVQSGWRHYSSGGPMVVSQANLIEEAAVEGRRGLQLTAQKVARVSVTAVEHTPIWIESGPMTLPANHLIRIAGHVRIDQPIVGSLDGVTITDSLGGVSLQQRFAQTQGWQPFVIYRATSEPATLKLTIALNGLGSLMLDELTVQMAPLPAGGGQIRPQLDLPDGAEPPMDTRPPVQGSPDIAGGMRAPYRAPYVVDEPMDSRSTLPPAAAVVQEGTGQRLPPVADLPKSLLPSTLLPPANPGTPR